MHNLTVITLTIRFGLSKERCERTEYNGKHLTHKTSINLVKITKHLQGL